MDPLLSQHSVYERPDRLSKISQVYSKDITALSPDTMCAATFDKLKTLSSKEIRIWWDLTGLQQYINESMIPRGLRIKKIPSTLYSESFLTEWNTILSKCSLELMSLIVSHEEALLRTISTEIQSLKESLLPIQQLSSYATLLEDLTAHTDKLEAEIMDTKRHKYLRDLQDYEQGEVYTYKKAERPHSILKNRRRCRRNTHSHVSFSSLDHSDSSLELSDVAGVGSSLSSRASVSSVFSKEDSSIIPSKNSSVTQDSRDRKGKQGGGPVVPKTNRTSYPRKARNK